MLHQYNNFIIDTRAITTIYKAKGWIGKILPNMLSIILTIIEIKKAAIPPPECNQIF